MNYHSFSPLTEALLADRKDALTERPLDFDKEEQTRKGETIKWLESHFGSESRSSRDSRDDEIEPTKKTFFNVTIKSNPTTPTTATVKPFPYPDNNAHLLSPSKVIIPEKETSKKYFQGISEWSERKETTAPKHFPPKSFQEELKGTLERNRLKHAASRDDLRHTRHVKEDFVRKKDDLYKLNSKTDQKYGSRGDLKYSPDARGGESSDEYRPIKMQKEDLGYLSGSRNDVRHRKDSKEDIYAISSKKQNAYLHREDSGYVKDSREDIRYNRNTREDSFIRDSGEEEPRVNKAHIQRDDSAYISSSTYFTAPRSPKSPKMRTPDSGIRSPSPDTYDVEDVRPTVPQRKRVLEKKLRLQQNGYGGSTQTLHEPPPDYSPPPRSRSISPYKVPSLQHYPHHHHQHHPQQHQQQYNQTKKYQRTRFASAEPTSRKLLLSNTQTTSPPPPPPQPSQQKIKVGSVIGNSIRKLVGKIRSASAERKLKLKTKRSPSPQKNLQQHHHHANASKTISNGGSSTYQQYNVIDGHIGQVNRESSIASSGRRERTLERRGSSDIDNMVSPKQKFYLGEDPYGGSIYGKENKYDGVRPHRMHSRRQRSEDIDIYNPSR